MPAPEPIIHLGLSPRAAKLLWDVTNPADFDDLKHKERVILEDIRKYIEEAMPGVSRGKIKVR